MLFPSKYKLYGYFDRNLTEAYFMISINWKQPTNTQVTRRKSDGQ